MTSDILPVKINLLDDGLADKHDSDVHINKEGMVGQ